MKKKILYVLGVFGVLVFVSFLVLKNGISISSVHSNFLTLEQLYIKLDKKLILRAKNITLNLQNNKNSQNIDDTSKELLEVVKNINYLYMLVQEIDIANFDFKDDHIRILFKNDDFLVNNKLFLLKINLQKPSEHLINADIKKLWIKDYNLSIEGNLDIDTKSQFYHFNAKAYSHLIDFNTSISYKKGQMSYEITNANTKHLSQILEQILEQSQNKIALSQHLTDLLTKGIKAEFYHIEYLKGFADLKKQNYYLDEIQSSSFMQNAEIKLNHNMNAIKIPHLALKLEAQRLDFNFDKATYNGANLDKSKIYLYDIFNKNIGMSLHILSHNLKLDEKLFQLLKSYGLTLPFYQKSGAVKTDFNLKIAFLKTDRKNIQYNGEFELKNASLSLLDFNVTQAFVYLKQDDLKIENADVKNDFLEAHFDANIDLLEKKGAFLTDILRLHNEFIDMKNQKINLNLDFSQAVKMSVPQWGLDMNFQQGLEASLSKISALVPYAPLLQKFNLKNASNVYYKSENFKDFTLKIDEAQFKSDFLIAGKTPYERDSFHISNQNGKMQIHSKSNLVNANLNKENKEIHLNNLTYIYKKSEGGNFNIDQENIVFGGANFGIILADMNKTLQFDRIEASLDKGIINAKANKNQADFELYYSPDDLKLEVKNMNDEFINTFLQKQAVQDGVFNLNVKGSGLEFFSGQFELKNTFLKDLKGINALISFIDTVPSLLLFKSPTFNQKGLSLIEGKVVFNRKKDLLSIEAINLNGESVDIFGLGNANLRLSTIDLDLELKTLKSASTAISKVPFLNYVILGKDQEISTNLKIDGTFEDPKFHTQILTDTLKTPFNLIKNIIQLPVNLFQ